LGGNKGRDVLQQSIQIGHIRCGTRRNRTIGGGTRPVLRGSSGQRRPLLLLLLSVFSQGRRTVETVLTKMAIAVSVSTGDGGATSGRH